MRFGEVDIPQELIDARRNGDLAVFAGAGVSVAPPSNLPGFDDLVKLVAQDTPGVDPKERKEKRFDRFLGELHRGGEGVNVHEIVHREIDDPDAEPTPLHYELLGLFDEASQVRIVTTNFDRHFTTAARDYFDGEVPHYYAPALPPGDDFSGIAYLHGSVEQTPEELVLTDEDFSQAYITKGWARRFLQRLFSDCNVLFVGYSHGEAVIEYLARGISATDDKGRFALDKGWEDPCDDPTEWEYFGIRPIEYPRNEEGGDHANLPKALKVWNRYARETARERADRIETIVDQAPSELSKHQSDILEDRLQTSQGAHHFTDAASTSSWLFWAHSEGFLAGLFESGSLETPEEIFAQWIGSKLIPEHPDAARSLIGPNANRLNPEFWKRIVRGLWDNNETEALSPEELIKWSQLLLISPPANLHDLSLLLSDGLRMPEDRKAALLLFEFLTEPIAAFEKAFTHPDSGEDQTEPSAQHKVKLRDETAQLPRAWEQVLKPHLPGIAIETESIARANLQKLYRLYESVDRTHPNGETPVSIHRSAIESHPQDEHSSRQEGEYVLIDAARDSIECLLDNQPDRASRVIQNWSEAGIPLLERLAVHAMAENSHVDSENKIQWLLDRGWIYTPRLKHEVFRLLEKAYPSADDSTREALLEQVWEEWPEEGEEDRDQKAYRVYNIIQWLAGHAEECSLVEDRLEAIEAEFPDFTPREHPDLDYWVGEFEAIQPEDYSEELLRRSPADQFDRIVSLLKGDWIPHAEDSLDEDDVQTAISKNFEWGFDLMEELADRERWEEEIWRPVWRGVRETTLEAGDWKRLLSFIQAKPELHSHSNGLSSLLQQRSKPDTGDLPVSHLETAEEIADAVYAESRDEPVTVGGDARLSEKLLNHPGASLAFFYIYSLWSRNEEEELSGLPEEYRQRFSTILNEDNRAARAGQMVLGARLSFLHHIDEDWALDTLLPYFGWGVEEIGRRVWTGLLYMGQALSPALAQEMKETSQNAFPHVSKEPEHFRDRLAGFVASLSLSDAIDPLEAKWLQQYLDDAEQDRVRWADQMRRRLGQLGEERVNQVWQNWLEEYWKLRLDGKPSLTGEEAAAMIEWTPALGSVIGEVVPLISEGPAPDFQQHSSLFLELEDQEFGKHHPSHITDLLTFILQEAESLPRDALYYGPNILKHIAATKDCPSDEFEELVDLALERFPLERETADRLGEQC
jgi:hypothetical protein